VVGLRAGVLTHRGHHSGCSCQGRVLGLIGLNVDRMGGATRQRPHRIPDAGVDGHAVETEHSRRVPRPAVAIGGRQRRSPMSGAEISFNARMCEQVP
jgi:hypothetical protein